jgi:hypothetical protein
MRNNAMLLFHSRAILRAGINRIRKLAGAEPLPEEGFSVRGELKQAGQIVVIFALMLVVLIGLVGIAIDTTYAWRESLRVQRAADAASLAGVVSMPGAFGTATITADSEAAKNGYTSSSTTSIAVTKANNPDELDVSITTQVPTFFSRIFGINSFTVTRSSKAVYILPVPMGSPENYYGSFGSYQVNGSPVALKGPGGETLNARGFWGSVLTQGADIVNGDAYMPKFNNGGNNPNPQDTTDYYNYAVYMPPGSTGGHVSIFDPGFCDTDQQQGTGETWFSGTGAVSTWYQLYNTNNQPYNLGAQTFLGSSGSMFINEAYSDSTEGGSGGSSCKTGTITDPTNGEYYHDKWWDLTNYIGTTLSGGMGGTTYRIHVTTDPGDTTQDSVNGQNNFALFASATGGSPEVYGIGAMQMYTPLPQGQSSTFYLAQISQQAGAGKTIQINLWDPGDTHMTADLYILQPTASGWSPVSLTWTCQKLSTDGSASNCSGGSGTYVETSTGATSHFNGCWLYISIAVPTSYTAPQSGWWKIQYTMGSASGVYATDETTWQVNIKGNPVHLIG